MSEHDFVSDDDLLDPDFEYVQEAAAHERIVSAQQNTAQYLSHMKGVYTRVLAGNPIDGDVRDFINDMKGFARWDEHFFSNARLQDVMAGRKQAVQRILEYTGLPLDVLVNRYASPDTKED